MKIKFLLLTVLWFIALVLLALPEARGQNTVVSYQGRATLNGVRLGPNWTAWGTLSDRNVKKDFTPVNSEDVLEKLAALPITRWHYRWEETNSPPHLGPMAQDFKAAFYPGTDDKTITTQEADGVALAAIQGLNQKLERKDAELNELKNAVRELQELVQALGQKSTQGQR